MKRHLLLAVIVGILAGCTSGRQETTEIKRVKTGTVVIYGESPSVTFPGKIIAASDINLAFRVSGPIQRVYGDVGAYVRKGQVVAEIDPRDYEIQLAATQAEYEQIKNETQRITELHEKESIAPNDYEKAIYGLKQIAAKYDAHRNALQDTKLTAPCDGYIQKRLFEAGETVSAGLPVLSMISAATAEVEINIPSSDYIRRDQFDSYSCQVDIFPGRIFPLELIGITRKANMNQLYTMRFRLAGDGKNIPGPGMSTLVTIHYKPAESAIVSIPLTSLFESAQTTQVWIYQQNSETITARTVKVAEILGNGTAVISSGLTPGEVVITAGAHSLKEGEKVKPLAEVSSTNIGDML